MSLHWLSRRDRSVPIPEVAYVEESDFGGWYARPEPAYPNGCIVVSADWLQNPEDEPAALAHEWQHHVQLFSGRISQDRREARAAHRILGALRSGALTYEQAMGRYFRIPSEREAALETVRRLPGHELSRYWLSLSGLYVSPLGILA